MAVGITVDITELLTVDDGAAVVDELVTAAGGIVGIKEGGIVKLCADDDDGYIEGEVTDGPVNGVLVYDGKDGVIDTSVEDGDTTLDD